MKYIERTEMGKHGALGYSGLKWRPVAPADVVGEVGALILASGKRFFLPRRGGGEEILDEK